MMERKIRVMLFEDNQSVRTFVEKILKSKKCEVIPYEDPSLCLLQSSHDCRCSGSERCTDIILTDIDMPNVSGIDFIESQMGKGCKAQSIAIMSGAWSDVNRKRAESLGCTVFEKPLSLPILSEWLDKCLERVDQDKRLSNWFQEEKGI
jgi:DNA-binding NtrC family response regulator